MKKLVLIMLMFAPMATFAQKFGYVNTQSIMQSMPEVSKANGELEAKAKEFENDLKAMQDELQRKSEEYDKTKSTMNATKQQETEASLQDMYTKIQQTYQDNQQELRKLQEEKMQPIITKIRNAIDAVGKAGSYVFIFEDGAAVYQSATLSKDVTAEVKTQLTKMK